MRRYITAAIIGAIVVAGGPIASGATQALTSTPATTGTVVRVIDGDTFVVRTASGERVVRLIGVNTPETVKPGTAPQCWGKQASNLTKKLLPAGTRVQLHTDKTDVDRYGRWLRYVHKGGRDVGSVLLRAGAAHTMSIAPNTARARQYSKVQTQAQTRGVGMWGACR